MAESWQSLKYFLCYYAIGAGGGQTEMPRRPLRPCSAIGCHRLTDQQYCEEHIYLTKMRHKIYDQYYRDKRVARFYKSREWIVFRQKALERDHYLCQECLRQQKITPATTVHHKVPLQKDWSRKLDLRNLESLCASCHNKAREHHE